MMPCLNEERTLPRCIEAARRGIDAAGIEGEVIALDNG
jgi:glycosyltransferase involved in cell wall biosynthesis